MKRIAVFQSDRFDRGEEDPIRAEIEPPGRDCALALMRALEGIGMGPTHPYPFAGEGGWSFTVQSSPAGVGVFVHWVPIGDPPEDYWAVQLTEKTGVLQRLVRRHQDSSLRSMIASVDELLAGIGATKLRWLTDEEFAEIY